MNPEFPKMYKQQIDEYITLGHARKLSKNEKTTTTSITSHIIVPNYIPHRGVTNVNKPGEVRVVFDASAKFRNTSLNEHLLPGLDLLNDLVSVLLKL